MMSCKSSIFCLHKVPNYLQLIVQCLTCLTFSQVLQRCFRKPCSRWEPGKNRRLAYRKKKLNVGWKIVLSMLFYGIYYGAILLLLYPLLYCSYELHFVLYVLFFFSQVGFLACVLHCAVCCLCKAELDLKSRAVYIEKNKQKDIFVALLFTTGLAPFYQFPFSVFK